MIDMFKIVALLFGLAACRTSVPIVAHLDTPKKVHCFNATLVDSGETHVVVGCAGSSSLCSRARSTTRENGRLVGIRNVTHCRAAVISYVPDAGELPTVHYAESSSPTSR